MSFSDGDHYNRPIVTSNFELLGKYATYVCPLTNDDEILEVLRVSPTLVQYGVRRHILVIPFLGYSTMERAIKPDEIVTAKCTIQMLYGTAMSSCSSTFTAGLLHYFERPCIRLEICGRDVLTQGLASLGFDPTAFIFASAGLGRSAWINAFACDNGTAVAFVRKIRVGNTTKVCEVIGQVAGKHVIIYDDMTRTSGTIIHAAKKYVDEVAVTVDVPVEKRSQLNYIVRSTSGLKSRPGAAQLKFKVGSTNIVRVKIPQMPGLSTFRSMPLLGINSCLTTRREISPPASQNMHHRGGSSPIR
jgi:ribose-phosphate pyrophosphokinase